MSNETRRMIPPNATYRLSDEDRATLQALAQECGYTHRFHRGGAATGNVTTLLKALAAAAQDARRPTLVALLTTKETDR